MSVKISEVPIEFEIEQVSADTSKDSKDSKNENDNMNKDEKKHIHENHENQDNQENHEKNKDNNPPTPLYLGKGGPLPKDRERETDNNIITADNIIDDNKKKRGRPKGSLNKPKAKATESRVKAKKPDATHSQREDDDTISDTILDTTSDTLPAYVQQSPDYTMPQPQDLASQLFGLLQRHEHERTNRRRATYASWMTRF